MIRPLRLFMACLVLIMSFPRMSSTQENWYTIKVRVFEIPPIQSVVGGAPDGKGGIIGTQTGGDISTSFPPRVVFIKTALDSNAPDGGIKQALLDNGYFKEASEFMPSGISWWPVDEYSISYSAKEFGEESSRKTYHEPRGNSGRNRHGEFWLTVLPKSVEDPSATLRLRFETGESNKRTLLDQDISVPLGKMLVVGFPTETASIQDKRNSRGSIFILAISVQNTGI